MNLKIGTYNVCHCADFEQRKDGEEFIPIVSIEKTAKTIKNLGLDFIGLNEVYSEGEKEDYCNQTEKLAKLAGYDYFAFALGEKFSWTTIGNAFLSRYPIVSVKRIIVKKPAEEDRFPKDAYWEDRVLLVVDVNVDGNMIRVVETHFGLNLMEQENIVKEVCKVIDESEYPVILMGDFNVTPEDKVIEQIYERLISATLVTGNKEFTFASYDPRVQIDYIFVPKTAKVTSCVVHDVLTSDHRPLTASIVL